MLKKQIIFKIVKMFAVKQKISKTNQLVKISCGSFHNTLQSLIQGDLQERRTVLLSGIQKYDLSKKAQKAYS